ncbi:MAG: BON domain-containing protein [Chloroflexota bacterium]|nr:MAG: BON domain-containing protein [Chloroflexota bacterium]
MATRFTETSAGAFTCPCCGATTTATTPTGTGASFSPQMGQGFYPPAGQGFYPQMGQGFYPQYGMGYYPGMGVGFYPQMEQGYYPQYGMGYYPHLGMGFHPGMGGGFGFSPSQPYTSGWGLGGLRTWGGTYTPQYLTTGLPTDEEITEMVYDTMDSDPLVPWDAEITVDVNAGEVTLSGTVPNKRIKHAAGDDAWWIPGVTDVHNQIQVAGRHRGQAAAEGTRTSTRRRTGTTGGKTQS